MVNRITICESPYWSFRTLLWIAGFKNNKKNNKSNIFIQNLNIIYKNKVLKNTLVSRHLSPLTLVMSRHFQKSSKIRMNRKNRRNITLQSTPSRREVNYHTEFAACTTGIKPGSTFAWNFFFANWASRENFRFRYFHFLFSKFNFDIVFLGHIDDAIIGTGKQLKGNF